MKSSSIGDKIYCKVQERMIEASHCLGCELPCEDAYRRFEYRFSAVPEGESSHETKSEPCRLHPITEQEFLKNPVAQCIPENEDPHGIGQHEMGAKLDAHKIKAGVLGDFGRALEAVAQVGTFGIKKYARGSWQHVPDGVERYTDALWRHLLQENKEPEDTDSGLPHEFHVAWNALARLELLLRDREKLLREREVNGSLHTTDGPTHKN